MATLKQKLKNVVTAVKKQPDIKSRGADNMKKLQQAAKDQSRIIKAQR